MFSGKPDIVENNIQCNVIQCRMIIYQYLATNTTYNSRTLRECDGCAQAFYPNFPDWSSLWNVHDFVIFTARNTDIPGNPYTNTLTNCQTRCLTNIQCVGFSRAKSINDSINGPCYLKQNISSSVRSLNNSVWQTWVFSNP